MSVRSAAAFCGRHVVCGEHWADGFVGRVNEDDYGFAAGEIDAAAGGDGGASGAWAADYDWGRAGFESVFDDTDDAVAVGFCMLCGVADGRKNFWAS